jgi:hypothetical protein
VNCSSEQPNAAETGPHGTIAVNMKQEEMIPHDTMIRAIQMRAPTLRRIRLLGTSNTK